MLHNIIEEAKRQGASAVRSRIGFFALLVLVAVTVLFLLVKTLAPPPPGAIQNESLSAEEAPGEEVSPQDPAASSNVVEPYPLDGSEQDVASLRAQFITALGRYEEEWEPQLAGIDWAAWDPARANALTSRKQDALKHFAEASYRLALNALTDLEQQTKDALRERGVQFDQAYAAAQSAHARLDYDQAVRHIGQALILDQDAKEAQALQARIEHLPQLLPWMESARVARVENKPEEELRWLAAILKQDPEWQDVQKRHQVLQKDMQASRYAALIQEATALLAQGKIQSLQVVLRQAEALAPGRPELIALREDLAALERNRRLQLALEEARRAQLQDDWPRAQRYFTKALAESPTLKEANTGLQEAKRLIELGNALDLALQDPYRLADPGVASRARNSLQEAESYQAKSPRLQEKSRQLEHLLQQVGRDIAVQIHSDGSTHIRVRGVGEVGVTTSRTINLKPGHYTFEGRRKGYKSKLLPVRVPYDQDLVRVYLVCDEPI